MRLNCSKCERKLSKKSARMVEGKVICSSCLFPKMVQGVYDKPSVGHSISTGTSAPDKSPQTKPSSIPG
jgi:hypothetical protein